MISIDIILQMYVTDLDEEKIQFDLSESVFYHAYNNQLAEKDYAIVMHV